MAAATQYYLNFLRDRDLNDLYTKVAAEAAAKFPTSRVLGSHRVAALLRTKDYKAGGMCGIP